MFELLIFVDAGKGTVFSVPFCPEVFSFIRPFPHLDTYPVRSSGGRVTISRGREFQTDNGSAHPFKLNRAPVAQ